MSDQTNSFGIFKPLTAFQEKDARFLVPTYVPAGVLTTLAGDGGSGKTTVWADLAAAISTGRKCFFDPVPDDFADRRPDNVVFLSAEDSVEIVLKKRLSTAGADMSRLYTASLQEERFKDLKFNSPELKQMIENIRPALVVFDPLQGFVPESINMGSRNDMRNLLSPLIGVGEKTGTAFMIVVHTNKRAGVYGRNRIADSADIWDISRSVLIVGKTQDGTRYISHEKSNYCEQGQTVLFEIEQGQPKFLEHTDQRDCEFVRQTDFENRQAPQRSDAKEFIIEQLRAGKQPTAELEGAAKARGISNATLSRAKTELKKAGLIGYSSTGSGVSKQWFIYLVK